MKAYVTSIGEPTTRLCCDQLKRYGFEVEVLKDSRTLWGKLKEIYSRAEGDFLRVDADFVPNENIKDFWTGFIPEVWWVQPSTFDWYRQMIGHGGAQFIRKDAIPALRMCIDAFQYAERPETEVSRVEAFHKPRRMATSDVVVGLHGYKQGDLSRIKAQKHRRGQSDNYDWTLVEELEAL